MAANRAVDDYAINTYGIPGETLMQNAGYAVIEQMEKHGYLSNDPTILILAGKGNNGGDGFVIARGLMEKELNVSLITVSDPQELKGDALFHYQLLVGLGLEAGVWESGAEQQTMISKSEVIVDALLGTGISGEIREPYTEIITLCNKSEARIVAVDVPSGVTGDDGEVLEPCIRAELTVSMGFGKQGCLFEPARSQSGKIETVEIGFPEDSLAHVEGKVLYQTEAEDFSPKDFSRPGASHKYSVGKVYIIAGSRGFTGAAVLASKAALRSGAGLVKLALPGSLGIVAEQESLETIVEYLPETADGSFSQAGSAKLETGCAWANVVVIGPGIGRNTETLELVRDLVAKVDKPLVLDADALFAIKDDLDLLQQRSAPCIITPHLGEFLRLGTDYKDSKPPHWEAALAFAQTYGTHVLLKGAPSLLAYPDGTIMVNNSGHAGMATAGSGDVLSGVLGGLWSQWPEHADVLRFGMYIHGKAADHMKTSKGTLGMIAGDIVEALPTVLKEYGGIPD